MSKFYQRMRHAEWVMTYFYGRSEEAVQAMINRWMAWTKR